MSKTKEYKKNSAPRQKRIVWTKSEDEDLESSVQEVTVQNMQNKINNESWKKICDKFNEKRQKRYGFEYKMRENKRIKEHYQQCLQKYNKTTFSDEENKLLLSLVSNNGNKWTSFGKYFPDRSIPLIKNAYKKLIKQNFMSKIQTSPNSQNFENSNSPRMKDIGQILDECCADKINQIFDDHSSFIFWLIRVFRWGHHEKSYNVISKYYK